jgi:glycosyltransferase involved in cell wall biosynthesis
MPIAAQNPMVVLQVIPRLDSGGAERGCLDVAAALSHGGHVALVASAGGRLEPELNSLGGFLLRLNAATKNPLGLIANVVRLMQFIRRYRVSVVHARSRAPAWSAYAAARLTGTPFVTTFHGAYSARTILKRFANSVMARADRVIAISNHIKRHVIDTYHTAPEKLVLIPRGIDLERFNPDNVSPDRVAAIKAQWGLSPNGPRVILIPGRMTAWKGQALAIESFAQLARPDTVLVLVGDGQGHATYEAALTKRIAELDLGDKVIMAGHCDDMPAAILAADIVLSLATGKPEAFGRVPVEAQAMGRPPIATALGGALETVVDGLTGWLVPEGDGEALTRAIAFALDLSEEARARMATQGRASVTRRFSKGAMTRATLDVYRDLLR